MFFSIHCLRENREISAKKDEGNVFFSKRLFFLGLGDGENCSPKIFEKFERGILAYFINKIDMFAPKH